jgi:RNA polymerase sigma factor (sigma-70 family)
MQDSSEVTRLLNEISRHELLTAEEEILLARSVQVGIQFEGQNESSLNAYQKISLRNARRAKKRMIESNLKLVYSVVKGHYSFWNKDYSLVMDLFQEGCIGLSRAVEKFDPERGYKFSTYATWWIRQAIGRGYHSKIPMIAIPEWVSQKYTKIKQAIQEFKETYSRYPTNEEISQIVDLPVSKIKAILDYNYNVISLNQTVGRNSFEEANEIIDLIASEEKDDSIQEQIENLHRYISKLEPQEQQIVNSRYGLNGYEPKTLDDLSKRFGITKERVRQIQVKAINKIRFMSRAQSNGRDVTSLFEASNIVNINKQLKAKQLLAIA